MTTKAKQEPEVTDSENKKTPALTVATKRPFTIKKVDVNKAWLNFLVYGGSGTGKTHLAGTADDVPEMRDVLYIDAEGGMLTLKNRTNLDVVSLNRFQEIGRIHEFLIRHCRMRDANDVEGMLDLERKVLDFERDEPARYRTCVIDSLSEVQRYNMYQLLGIEIGEQNLSDEYEAPEYKEWLKTTEMTKLTVRSFRDLPIHMIFVCSEKLDDKTNKMTVNFPKELAKEIPYLVDAVGFYQAAPHQSAEGPTVLRRLDFGPSTRFVSKHRFGDALQGTHIENPEMRDILELLKRTN